jgi:pyruvate dehydrogenase E1 component
VYDPFVLRGLDAFVYGTYIESRFIVVGTPSGVSLSSEGGAHQSIVTPSVGMQLPNVVFAEPAYAAEVDWLLCDSAAQLFAPEGESAYLRLSTRAISQEPFEAALRRDGRDGLRHAVLAGGYCIRESTVDGPVLNLVATGAVLPEALDAAAVLEEEGVRARVVNVTSADRLFRGWRTGVRQAVASSTRPENRSHLDALFPADARTAPIVAVQDGAPHGLAWLGSVYGAKVVPLGVDRHGQSGSLTDVYAWHQLGSGAIVNAGLLALDGA